MKTGFFFVEYVTEQDQKSEILIEFEKRRQCQIYVVGIGFEDEYVLFNEASDTTVLLEVHIFYLCTRWFKYDRDYLCVNKSQFVPVIFEPPCRNRLFNANM
jgi:hypothetical protein